MLTPGDRVEIVDPSHRLYRMNGIVRFCVGDNIYVRFAGLRWRSVRVFFPEQLRGRPRPNAEDIA